MVDRITRNQRPLIGNFVFPGRCYEDPLSGNEMLLTRRLILTGSLRDHSAPPVVRDSLNLYSPLSFLDEGSTWE